MTRYYNFDILDIQLNCEISLKTEEDKKITNIKMNINLNNEEINLLITHKYNYNFIMIEHNNSIFSTVYGLDKYIMYRELNILECFNIISTNWGQVKKFLPMDRSFIEKKIFNIFGNNKYNKSLEMLNAKINKLYSNRKYFDVVNYEYGKHCQYYFVTSDDYSYYITGKFIYRLSPEFSEVTKIQTKKIFEKMNNNDNYSYIQSNELSVHIIGKSGKEYKIENIQLSEDSKSVIIQIDEYNIIVNINEFE